MDKNFMGKLAAAVLVFLFFFFLVGSGWQVALAIGLGAFVLDLIFSSLKLGDGWLLFIFGLFAFFAFYWSGLAWGWFAAFGGWFYYAMNSFLDKSGLDKWFFGLFGVK